MMGPGTRLKGLLRLANLIPTESCNCEAYSKEMDNRGVEWCEANTDVILGWIEEEARARQLPFFRVAVKPILAYACKLARKDFAALPVEGSSFEESVINEINSLRSLPIDRPKGWKRNPITIEAHRRLLDEVATHKFKVPHFNGNGIITLLGTAKYFPVAYNLCYTLRKLKCTTPITGFYLGDEELDLKMKTLLSQLDVEVINLLNLVGNEPRCLGGWEAKIWAIMKSPYAKVLFLDADNIPVRNPDFLFKHDSAILWPDWRGDNGLDITDEAFYVAGLPCPGRTSMPTHYRPADYRPVESGQLYINKQVEWNALNVVRHICDHSDFWWGGDHWFIYGDKSAFYLAYERTKTEYLKPAPCGWFGDNTGGGFNQYDMEGRLIFQHRCQPVSKIQITSDPNLQGVMNKSTVTEALKDLKEKWKGSVWSWDDQDERDMQVARIQFGEWAATQFPVSSLTLADAGRVNNNRQYRWRIVHYDHKPMLVLSNDQKAVSMLSWAGHEWKSISGTTLKRAPHKSFKCLRTDFEIGLWNDVVVHNEYKLPDSLNNKVILDVGAHVGMFAHACVSRGAKEVWAVEATPFNFVMLYENMVKYNSVKCINAAVWRSDAPAQLTRMSTVDGADHSGGFVVNGTGEYALKVPLNTLLNTIGKVDLLKLDCEGSEWPILFTSDLSNVSAICGEYHARWLSEYSGDWLSSTPYSLDSLSELLKSAGFNIHLDLNIPGDRGLGHFYAWRQHEAFFKGIN